VISVTWSETERNGDAEREGSTFDLWMFHNESRCCKISPRNEGFWCYIYRITEYQRICIPCVELCHHGHDVLLPSFDSDPCSCGTN
jgi:hypothetical protein